MTNKRFHHSILLICTLTAAFILALLPVLANATPVMNQTSASNAKDLFFVQLKNRKQMINNGFSYTVELHRSNKAPVIVSPQEQFVSGDGIKVRIKSNFTGYAYIVLAQGSTGKQTVLFPPQTSSRQSSTNVVSGASSQDNLVTPDREYVIPEKGVIRFDNKPGVERLLFILSRSQIDARKIIDSGAGVSVNGAVGTGSNETPGIVILHDNEGGAQPGATYVVKSDPASVVYVELALNHVSAGELGAIATRPHVATGSPPPETTGGLPSVSQPPETATLVPNVPPPASSNPIASTIATVSPPLVPSVNRPVTDKWAVVVGLSKYRDSNMNLKAPHKDAEAFAEFLTNEAGFAPTHVIRIYDSEATRANILGKLEEIGQKIRPDDLFVFYANCHGSANTATPGNFLLMYDYSGEDSMNRQLLMQDLSGLLKSKVSSERMILIVQACHSGFVKAGQVPSAEAVSNDLQGVGRIIATACMGSESSWVYKRGGVFTMALIPNLRKYPKLKEALTQTRLEVMRATESERESRQMHPVIKYDLWMGDDAVLMGKTTDPKP